MKKPSLTTEEFMELPNRDELSKWLEDTRLAEVGFVQQINVVDDETVEVFFTATEDGVPTLDVNEIHIENFGGYPKELTALEVELGAVPEPDYYVRVARRKFPIPPPACWPEIEPE